MPIDLKRITVLVLGLAALFSWSFLFLKHDPALGRIIPFGDDPYDAVGSFAFIVGPLFAVLSLLRAFRPYQEAPSTSQRMYLMRAQEAVVLAVFLTLAADAVAMARHPSMWMDAQSRNRLIALLGVLVIAAAAVQWLIRRAQRKPGTPGTIRWPVAASVAIVAILVLAAYPESLIDHTPTHLLTVIAGAVVLFAPMRFLLVALVPPSLDNEPAEKLAERGGALPALQRWALALGVGTLIGALAFLGEVGEGGMHFSRRMAFIAVVYIALALAGVLIAYACLGGPLGLQPRK